MCVCGKCIYKTISRQLGTDICLLVEKVSEWKKNGTQEKRVCNLKGTNHEIILFLFLFFTAIEKLVLMHTLYKYTPNHFK